jgi:hypothetical protein
MQAARAIEILERQRAVTQSLRNLESTSPEFAKWLRDTEVALERIFGADSRNIADFKAVRYSLIAWSSSTPDSSFREAYHRGLAKADAILASMVDEIREYEPLNDADVGFPDHLILIERLCLRFHAAARQLQDRHEGRETIRIEDEYDVQDLLHAFLRLHFDDVRPEEWSPSYAGKAARLDFLLKREKIVIEVKKTRASMKTGELGEQLIIDRARYEHHPDCDLLVCFVFDPEGRIGNPIGLERDLENNSGGLKIRVIVAPKG